MSKKILFLLVIASISVMFAATSATAGTKFEDVIILDTPGIKGDKYKESKFTHKKHVDYGFTCAECHHDDKGKSIKGLKKGDNVQKCIECHSNTKMDKNTKKDKMSFYYAFHGKGTESCKGCHKDHNTSKKLEKGAKGYAPNSCKDCHAKKAKKKK